MDVISKKQMSEEDIKLHYITPAITAQWNIQHITMETKVTDGRINLKGNLVIREKPKRADYVLYVSANNPIAIVEAKQQSCGFLWLAAGHDICPNAGCAVCVQLKR